MTIDMDHDWTIELKRLKRALDGVYEVYWHLKLKNPELYEMIRANADHMFETHRDKLLEDIEYHYNHVEDYYEPR